MVRRIVAVGLLLAVIGCGGGVWVARSQVTAPFLAPGAADIQVAEMEPGVRQITYRMPNPDDGWQSAIARRLNFSGWRLKADQYAWGDTEKYKVVYTRTSQIWFLQVNEEAQLLGDRSYALIIVSYSMLIRR
jgi:hypothetical protein